jgi:hypothetical protein
MRKLLLLVLVLGACAVSPGPGDAIVTNVPRLSANGLSPDQLSATALTSGWLDPDVVALMADDPDAIAVLRYAVECALEATQSFGYDAGGVHHVITGAMGLGPDWATTGMSAGEAAWVSACVFSRTNASGTSIVISDRGAATGLATTSSELANYRVEEGAFWGNLFIDLGDVEAFSCEGVDQAANPDYGDLPLRVCAQWDGFRDSHKSTCGMNYAGLCTAVCATSSPYSGCAFPDGDASSAVVTTFLYGAL